MDSHKQSDHHSRARPSQYLLISPAKSPSTAQRQFTKQQQALPPSLQEEVATSPHRAAATNIVGNPSHETTLPQKSANP